MERIEGRKGEDQAFVEFKTKDGTAFFTQRAGAQYPVFRRTSQGHCNVLPDPCPTSLAEGERIAKAYAERHESGRSLSQT